MNRLTRSIFIALLFGAALVAGPVGQRPAAGDDGVRPLTPGPVNVTPELQRLWTPERMASARPMPLGEPKQLPNPPASVIPPAGAPHSVPAVAPKLRPGAVAPGPGAPKLAHPLPVPLADGYTYPFPYTSYEVFTEYNSSPYAAEGKLFFDDPADPVSGHFYCTAQVISSQNRSTLWTAGHCINSGGNQGNPGRFYTNHFFVPTYKDGFSAFGGWSARQIFALSAWINNGEYEYDIGAVVVAPNVTGLYVQDLVGGEGIAFNFPRIRHWHSFGYPADPSPPFNGLRLILCTASYAVNDSPDNPADPPAIGIGCNMGHGASGGCWIANFKSPGGECNGVNSYKYFTTQPEAMYGPYHGTAAEGLFSVASTT